MTFDGPVVTAALAAVAFIVWLVRLEGRVNVQSVWIGRVLLG